MIGLEQAIPAVLGIVLSATVLGGMVGHDYFLRSRAFALYLLTVIAYGIGFVFAPATFYQRDMWTAKEVVLLCTKLVFALEIARHTFAGFPHARRVVTGWALFIIAVGGAAAIHTFRSAEYLDLLRRQQPMLETTALVLFVLTIAYATRYRLPLDPFHEQAAYGFILVLGTYVFLLITEGSVVSRNISAAVDVVADIVTLLIWARASLRVSPHMVKETAT